MYKCICLPEHWVTVTVITNCVFACLYVCVRVCFNWTVTVAVTKTCDACIYAWMRVSMYGICLSEKWLCLRLWRVKHICIYILVYASPRTNLCVFHTIDCDRDMWYACMYVCEHVMRYALFVFMYECIFLGKQWPWPWPWPWLMMHVSTSECMSLRLDMNVCA